MNNDQALLIFIKNPEKGKVKTRLAQTAGNDKALIIYKALLQHTRKITSTIKASRYLFYSNFIDQHDLWSAVDFIKMQQEGTNLGARMKNAFAMAFEKHQKVIIIGSDCASLNTAIINQAFRLLDDHDFVVGPAIDGGYYLLGMRQHNLTIFEEIAWSTANVFPSTIKKIEHLSASYTLLPTLSDIDTESDWNKYGWELPG